MKTTIITALAILTLGSHAFAVDRLVPSQYATIQAAIDAAVDGDTVLVSSGTYGGGLAVTSKTLTIRGPAWGNANPSVHIVGGGTALRIAGNGSQQVTLENLYFRDATQGVVAENVDVVLNDCFLAGFSNSSGNGGCFRQVYRSVSANRCYFARGRAAWGGGIYVGFGSGTLTDCVFDGNSAVNSGGAGFVQSGSSLRLVRGWLANQYIDIATNSTGYLRDSRMCQAGMVRVAGGANVVDEGGNVLSAACTDCDGIAGPDLISIGLGAGDCDGDLIPDHCDVSCPAIQWPTSSGGNGHWYQRVPRQGRTWEQCLTAAVGWGGDLASIGSAAEQSAIQSLIPRSVPSITSVVYLGGKQAANAPPGAGWSWSDGSPWSFTSWEPGQPDGGERYLAAYRYANTAGEIQWGDWPASDPQVLYFAVEWSADCNSDGVVDYGQILAGQLADANTNGIPDICEGPTCRDADLFRNGVINGADLGILLSEWGPAYANTVSDINHDGRVDGSDLGFLLANWGPCQN
jgi:hypothetical protein